MIDQPYYVIREEEMDKSIFIIRHTSDGMVGKIYDAVLAHRIIDLLNAELRDPGKAPTSASAGTPSP